MQPLNLALIQTNTHWHDAAANRALFESWFEQVPNDADIVVLPEMFTTGFTMASAVVAEPANGDTLDWMRNHAFELDAALCGSVVIEDSGRYFNRFVWAAPGEPLVFYDKRHRFRMAGEHEHYAAGVERKTFTYRGWRICPAVCYDLRFPVWLRNRADYDLLLVVANWPAARLEAWRTLLRARAIENQAYVAAVNIVGVDGNGVEYSGGSAAIDPNGEVLVEQIEGSILLRATLAMAPLESLRAAFPVWQDADRFNLDVGDE